MTPRTLRRLHPARRDDIGDLLTRSPLPAPGLAQLDPFLLLNHHGPQHYPPGNRGLPFGPHPHRGFETVTFIVDGELSHLDSGGHESVIGAGGVQWMTAGRGLVHAELSPAAFKAAGGGLEILQLWINLPAALKMSPPRYIGLQAADIPSFAIDGGRIDPVSGDWFGRRGAVAPLTDMQLAVVRLAAGARLALPVAAARTVFLYVVSGAIAVGGTVAPAHHLAEFAADGDAVVIDATADAVLLFGHALPFGEPVVAHGPFVMNTTAEIDAAIADYRAGRFGAIG